MVIIPHNKISTKHQKHRGCAPKGCRTIINKWEGGMLYQNMCDSLLFITRPSSTICKQLGPSRITTTIILWLLPAQDTPHDIINTKQMANKTGVYWKNGPGRSLPPDTWKCYNQVNLHSNSRKSSLSLHVVTLWHKTRTRIIYDCQQSLNRPRKWSTQGKILVHR